MLFENSIQLLLQMRMVVYFWHQSKAQASDDKSPGQSVIDFDIGYESVLISCVFTLANLLGQFILLKLESDLYGIELLNYTVLSICGDNEIAPLINQTDPNDP